MGTENKFEIGKTYKAINGNSITITRRTKKTIWFCDGEFSARIELWRGQETASPTIGIIRTTYRATEESR